MSIFPTSYSRRCALTIEHSKVPSDLSNYPLMISNNIVGSETNFPLEMLTIGDDNAALSDGGDIRFSSDESGITQIPCEIEVWTQDATPANTKAKVWVRCNLSSTVDTTIYVWWKCPGDSQPNVGSTYGKYAVWSEYDEVWHLGDASSVFASSKKDNDLVWSGSIPQDTAGKIGTASSFDGSVNAETVNGVTYAISDDHSLSAWVKPVSLHIGIGFYFGNLVADTPYKGEAMAMVSAWDSCNVFYHASGYGAIGAAHSITDSQWVYIHQTIEENSPAPSDILLYTDAFLETDFVVNNYEPFVAATGYCAGGITTSPSDYFEGSVQELRTKSSVSSPGWITAEYNNQSDPATFLYTGTPCSVNVPLSIITEQSLPQVLILGREIDLYEMGYVKDILDIEEYKTFQRDKLIDNEYTLEVKNFDDFFSVDNPSSILNSIQWRYSPLQVINENGITVWDGVIEDIKRDHDSKLAYIVSTSSLSQYSNMNIEYISSGWEDPATAAKNIMNTYGFTSYDNLSLQKSIDVLTDQACYVKCNIVSKDNLNLMAALEKLSEYSCADCYLSKGILYFRHFTTYTGGSKVTINENDLLKSPVVNSLLTEIINDYRIGYDACGDVPATDSNQGNIAAVSRTRYSTKTLPEMISDVNAQIKYKDATSARYIGEQYIKRTHKTIADNPRPLTQIEFSVSYDFKNYLDLQSYFKLTFSDEGWEEKLFEVFKISTNESSHTISILAVEVDV